MAGIKNRRRKATAHVSGIGRRPSAKTGNRPVIHAQCVTEAINLAAVALRAKKRIDYDSASMKITNDDAANRFLTRDYRKGWEI